MPSPVNGFTRDSASPASRTRPSGWRGRPEDSGRWCALQYDASAPAPGISRSSLASSSARLGLRTWDKPAAACLASRVPYGTHVSVAILTRAERTEAALHALGFAQCRVRHYDDTARIEVELDALPQLLARREEVVAAARAAGYRYVTLDLEGFRSGNLNAAL